MSHAVPDATSRPSGPDLSCVIPTLNEEHRLPATLLALQQHAVQAGLTFEAVVVDDGSIDETPDVARAHGARVLRLGRRRGPGVAVRTGMLAARGARVLLCDADGAVPFDDLNLLRTALDAGADVAVGSRAQPGCVEIPQPRHRILMGKAWGAFVRHVLPTRVRDTQCGFKLFTRRAAHHLFAQTHARGFAFHVEVIALAGQLGYTVVEIPVRWRDQAGSKIRLVRDPLHMASELLWVSWRLKRPQLADRSPRRTPGTDDVSSPTPLPVRRAS